MNLYEFRFCLRTKRMRAVLLRVDKETDKMIYGEECHCDNCSLTYGNFALNKDEIGKVSVNFYRIVIARVYGDTYEDAKAKSKSLMSELLKEHLDFAFGGSDE